MPNLDITLNVALNHGDIEKFEDTTVAVPGELPAADCTLATIGPGTTVDGCNVDRSDEDLPRLPKQTYYAAVQYFMGDGFWVRLRHVWTPPTKKTLTTVSTGRVASGRMGRVWSMISTL